MLWGHHSDLHECFGNMTGVVLRELKAGLLRESGVASNDHSEAITRIRRQRIGLQRDQ